MVQNIVDDRHGHVNTGIIGTLYVFHALREMDRNDVAYQIAAQDTYPSLGYMVRKGATSIWETWSDPGGMFAQASVTLGSLSVWHYQGLSRDLPRSGGARFKRTIIRAGGGRRFDVGEIDHISPSGGIIAMSTAAGDQLTMDVTIPANTSATVYVPEVTDEVLESGTPLAKARGVTKCGAESRPLFAMWARAPIRFSSRLKPSIP